MKTLMSLFFSVAVLTSYAQVEFVGLIEGENNKKMKDVKVNLYEDNDLVSTKYWDKKMSYHLDADKYYTLELEKDGFVPKRIAVSTFNGSKGSEPFLFRMAMVKEEHIDNNADLDFPSALIEYKQKDRAFHANRTYANSIKKDLKEAMKRR